MKKDMVRLALLGLLAAAMAAAPGRSFAQTNKESKDKPAAGAPAERPAKKPSVLPFRGTVAAVDKTAKTITVGERVFQVTSETRIFKQEKPATLDDVKVGEAIRGSYKKTDEGKLVAQRIRVGPVPEAPAKAQRQGPKTSPQ